MRPAPDWPARMRFHVVCAPQPRGVTMPIPVTTTRRMAGWYSWRPKTRAPRASTRDAARRAGGAEPGGSGAQPLLDELHGVAHRLDVLGGVVGNFDVELLLEGHDEFDVVQAVGAEIVDEAGLFRHLLR